MTWVRIIGIVGVILWGVSAITLGLAQQRSGLAPGEVDCPYRVQLIRNRVVALTLRAPRFREGDPQNDVVLHLIRETQEACSADASSTQSLEQIEAVLRSHLQHDALDRENRRGLVH